jgi:hypothetical protein
MSKLTRAERKILANQYLILEKIDPDNADWYVEAREILNNGYEADYEDVLQDVYTAPHTMSVEDCNYVGDVLQMYDMMQTAYKNGETAGVNSRSLKFPGFDGNNETKFMGYARHMKKHGKWDFLDLASTDFNSHFLTQGKYAKMLSEWNASDNRFDLTAVDIVRILG